MDTKREHRTHAEGSPRGNPYDLAYSPSGRLIGKYRDNNSVTLSATVDIGWYACEHQIIKHMTVSNCDDYQPHAVRRMFDYKNGMLYDMRWEEEQSSGLFDSVAVNKLAGNLGQVSIAKPGEMFETGRFLFWTSVGGFYCNVLSFYLNGINFASKKGAEAEAAFRSYFSPLTPNNYYRNCFGY